MSVCLYPLEKKNFILSRTPTYSALRKCILGLALLTLAFGIFHHSLFEFAHSLSHRFSNGHSYHSHHHNTAEATHKHAFLDISNMVFDLKFDSPISEDSDHRLKFSVDKGLEKYSEKNFTHILFVIKSNKIFNHNLQLPPRPFLQIPAPPPDFSV